MLDASHVEIAWYSLGKTSQQRAQEHYQRTAQVQHARQRTKAGERACSRMTWLFLFFR